MRELFEYEYQLEEIKGISKILFVSILKIFCTQRYSTRKISATSRILFSVGLEKRF